jgi:hypothetical protein
MHTRVFFLLVSDAKITVEGRKVGDWFSLELLVSYVTIECVPHLQMEPWVLLLESL